MRRPLDPNSLLLALAMAILGFASSADADPGANLAPPGPCAEPREALTGSAVASDAAFSVVGPLQSFFNPADVAAAPRGPSRAAPAAAAIRQPASCDRPSASCAPTPVVEPELPPIVPGPRPMATSASPVGGPKGVGSPSRPLPPPVSKPSAILGGEHPKP